MLQLDPVNSDLSSKISDVAYSQYGYSKSCCPWKRIS